MSTAIASTVATTGMTAKQAHDANTAYAAENKLGIVLVTGKTFPVRNVLYALGGTWNPQEKGYYMPAHTAEEAQAIVGQYAPKPKEAKPVQPPVAQVQSAPAPKVVKAKADKPKGDAPHNSGPNLILRTEALRQMVDELAKDVSDTAGSDDLVRSAGVYLTASRMGFDKAIKALKGE
jgi:hypothetical protein